MGKMFNRLEGTSESPTTHRSCQHPVGFLNPTRHRYQAGKENIFFRIAHRGLLKICSISYLTEPFQRGGGECLKVQ